MGTILYLNSNFSMDELFSLKPNEQATAQILAILVTLAFAVVGGLVTGNTELRVGCLY